VYTLIEKGNTSEIVGDTRGNYGRAEALEKKNTEEKIKIHFCKLRCTEIKLYMDSEKK
jgi:hypothetical protein